MKAYQQNTVVRARSKLPQIREIQVLCNQESRFLLRRLPYFVVRMTDKFFFTYCINIVTEFSEQGFEP